jgi:hypothetical protein
MEIKQQNRDLSQLRTDCNVIKDWVMDMEMSMKEAHQMMVPVKEDLQDLNNLVANVNNQVDVSASFCPKLPLLLRPW